MKKTDEVKKDEQTIRKLRECLMGMWEIREIRHFGETVEPETEADPFVVLRQLLDNAVICKTEMPYRGEK